MYMLGLMALFGPGKRLRPRRDDGRVTGGTASEETNRRDPDFEVGEMWMSRSELLARYLPRSGAAEQELRI